MRLLMVLLKPHGVDDIGADALQALVLVLQLTDLLVALLQPLTHVDYQALVGLGLFLQTARLLLQFADL